MIPKPWINRASALACVMLAGVALTSAIAVLADLRAVHDASRAAAEAEPPPPATTPRPPAGLKPLIRHGAAAPQVALNEYLNGKLGGLGLNVVSAETVSLRALGNGLQLAEIRVEANGDAVAAAAVANWVAVNREAVRMTSLAMTVAPDGAPRCSLVLLTVIA